MEPNSTQSNLDSTSTTIAPSNKSPLTDISLWVLLIANIATIYIAINEGWDLQTLMCIYWFQSVIIGFFNFLRILNLKEFSTEGFKINGRPADATESTKTFTAFFFLFHYGMFHFAYFTFLAGKTFSTAMENGISSIRISYILLGALVFFLSHLFSYTYNKPKDTKKQNIGTLMFYPYIRIIPMHLSMGANVLLAGAVPLFLVLKTAADCLMHISERHIRRGEVQ